MSRTREVQSAGQIRARLAPPGRSTSTATCIEYFARPGRLPPRGGRRPRRPTCSGCSRPSSAPTPDWYAARRRRAGPHPRRPAAVVGRRRPRNTRDLATALFPSCSTSASTSSASTSASSTRASGSCSCTPRRRGPSAGRVPGAQPLQRRDVRRRSPTAWSPVAAIPMHTPEEAVAELEYAVDVLGFKAVLLRRLRAAPGRRASPAATRTSAACAFWLDKYGIDSAYDYDPVWAKCAGARRVGRVPLRLRSGWGSRTARSRTTCTTTSVTSPRASTSLAKSLFLGGVTRRFPDLHFAFLEGGVAWAAALYADLVGHWEKRNLRRDRAHLDPALASTGAARRADRRVRPERRSTRRSAPCDRAAPRTRRQLDEWAACGIERAEDIRDLFVDPLLLRLRGRRPA